MKDFIKKNFAIVLAFALPICLVLFVAITSYYPFSKVSTNYNFIYTSCSNGAEYYSYQCSSYARRLYSVEKNKIVVNQIGPTDDFDRNGVMDVKENYQVRFFLQNTQTNEGREITLAEAQAMNVSSLLTSPDGVVVSGDRNSGSEFSIFFRSNSSFGYYLVKGNNRTKLNLLGTTDYNYYYDNFQFVGWVL